MKTDIKFRAWNVFEKEMDYEVTIDSNGKVAAYSPLDGQYVRGFSDSERILMQYTGFHEDYENQDEIYNGDIVELEYEGTKHSCEVKYVGCAYMFVADSLPDGFVWASDVIEFDRDYCWAEGTKKIGNIHENPELLESRR
ncbi:YopX family protein [Paenibacillus glucanolyticus]|uniref:YopX family protein n=1 Tax=Paenibacillus glucanolyticus TaxID=59843 RepID=UPI0030CBBE46